MMNNPAELQPLLGEQSPEDLPPTVLPAVPGPTPIDSRGVLYSTNSPRARLAKPLRPDPIEAARTAVVDLVDDFESLSEVERSNLFDDWKEALQRAAETGLARSGSQRQVIGMLLSTAHKKDVVNFSHDGLEALRSVTNIARMSPADLDTQRAARVLADHGLLQVLPLSPEGMPEHEAAELDAIVARFADGAGR